MMLITGPLFLLLCLLQLSRRSHLLMHIIQLPMLPQLPQWKASPCLPSLPPCCRASGRAPRWWQQRTMSTLELPPHPSLYHCRGSSSCATAQQSLNATVIGCWACHGGGWRLSPGSGAGQRSSSMTSTPSTSLGPTTLTLMVELILSPVPSMAASLLRLVPCYPSCKDISFLLTRIKK